jgi:nicotinamidase-related amidase
VPKGDIFLIFALQNQTFGDSGLDDSSRAKQYIGGSFLHPTSGECEMTMIRYVLLTSGWLLSACIGLALAQSGAQSTAAKSLVTLQMPALPDSVPVTVKAATTALLVFDMVDPICTTQPKCMATMVPAVTSLLAKARSAGVFVLYSTRGPTLSKWITQVAPASGDPVMQSYAQDRFYNTDLDKILKGKGIQTLILAGWKISGSVTYTSVGATARGYTVVVPQDATLATTDYETAIGIFQVLNQFDANATNEPLKAKASTLSRTEMITIQ